MKSEKQTYRIKVTGLVQGVGFRPFVYRLAREFGIKGTVDNRNDGVSIMACGKKGEIEDFIAALNAKSPKASQIRKIDYHQVAYVPYDDFRIIKSSDNFSGNEITEVSPDIAVCEECLSDMKTQPHRLGYSFINCTNCGPRFSIIKALPYDRPNTTMSEFELCDKCEQEYKDVNDRRFHAQPVACNDCGPHYELYAEGGIIRDIEEIINRLSALLENGGVAAVKGLGGFNLICDALNEDATLNLRKSKHRDGKPLAVMFRDEKALRKYMQPSAQELQMLKSWRRPIVIVQTSDFPNKVVTSGFNSVGCMLPYMPFHYQLFESTTLDALVYTSANLSGEPIIKDDEIALAAFESKMPVLIYNRKIHNRIDDSVGFVARGKSRLLRRSRGYAPSPVPMPFNADGILAVGAELVNCFCFGRGTQAIMSQHIGDLKNAETLEFFEESIERFSHLYKFEAKAVVCDMHPDYLSSLYARKADLPLIEVQHHHAHMASVMAENALDEEVIGVVMDGTGYGTDGKIWGGEFFTGDLSSFERYAHFAYVPIPGGDAAVKEPWRTALSYLYAVYGKELFNLKILFVQTLDKSKAELIIQLIDKKLNSPESSSAGRLFDAVSALLQLCEVSSFHAEAPMRLEDVLDGTVSGDYPYVYKQRTVDFSPAIKAIVDDLTNDLSPALISAKFHNTVANAVLEVCKKIKEERSLEKVVLSGGTFQNRYLSQKVENDLEAEGFKVFFHRTVPANDGGLALGQLAIAAKKMFNNL